MNTLPQLDSGAPLAVRCTPTFNQLAAFIVMLSQLGIPFNVETPASPPITQGRKPGKRSQKRIAAPRRAQNGPGLSALILSAVARGASRDGLRKMAVRKGYNESSVAPALTTLFAAKMLKGKGSETLELTEKAKAAA